MVQQVQGSDGEQRGERELRRLGAYVGSVIKRPLLTT
jgi:hypothetical protein